MPAAYKPYFDEAGGGGVEVLLDSNRDPTCAARVDTPEERDRVYGDRGLYPDCIEPGGGIHGQRVGRARLRMKREQVLKRLGPPLKSAHRVDRWCLIGKGELRIGYGAGGRVKGMLTSGRGQSIRGVARGDRLRRAQRRLDIVSSTKARHHTRILALRPQRHRFVWVGARKGRVRRVLVFGRSGISATTASRLISHVR